MLYVEIGVNVSLMQTLSKELENMEGEVMTHTCSRMIVVKLLHQVSI